MKIFRIQWSETESTVVLVHFEADTVTSLIVAGVRDRVDDLKSFKSLAALAERLRDIAAEAGAKLQVR